MSKVEKDYDLVFRNTETGRTQNFGAIVDRRKVGEWQTWLTYDEGQKMFWVISERRNVKLTAGYRLSRKSEAIEHFVHQTEAELDRGELETRRN